MHKRDRDNMTDEQAQERSKQKRRRLLTGKYVPVDAPEFDPAFKTAILAGMQGKPMYQGTVPFGEKLKRRAKGKRQRQARAVQQRRVR